jgi:hypothetical protein
MRSCEGVSDVTNSAMRRRYAQLQREAGKEDLQGCQDDDLSPERQAKYLGARLGHARVDLETAAARLNEKGRNILFRS